MLHHNVLLVQLDTIALKDHTEHFCAQMAIIVLKVQITTSITLVLLEHTHDREVCKHQHNVYHVH